MYYLTNKQKRFNL